jgi:PII-like signaling protein
VKLEAEQVLCRIHLSSRARHGDQPLYEWIVETARREDLQGATVLKGFLGLRPDGTVVREEAWSLAQEVPVVVEVWTAPPLTLSPGSSRPCDSHRTRAGARRAHRGGEPAQPRTAPALTPGDGARPQEVKTMKVPKRASAGLHRRATTRRGAAALYEAIVLRAREADWRGPPPPGPGLRQARTDARGGCRASTDLPIVVEIVDAEEKIRAFLPVVDELVTEGLVTLEAVRVLKYAAGELVRKKRVEELKSMLGKVKLGIDLPRSRRRPRSRS